MCISFVLLTPMNAGDVKQNVNYNLDLSQWIFCAICSLKKNPDNPRKGWEYIPQKVYWGSLRNVSNELFEHIDRYEYDTPERANNSRYLILIGDRDAGGPVFQSIPLNQNEIDLSYLGLVKEARISVDELKLALERLSLRMAKKHPIDDAVKAGP